MSELVVWFVQDGTGLKWIFGRESGFLSAAADKRSPAPIRRRALAIAGAIQYRLAIR